MKKNTLFIKTFLTLAFLLISLLGVAQSQLYTTPGTYTFTVPAGVSSVSFQAWGAGGGGSNRIGAAGAGGGGAFTGGTITGLSAGNTITVVVGNGGTVGNTGENTTINSIIIANGGASSTDRTGGTGGTASSISGFVSASFAGGSGGNARNNTSNSNNEAGGGGGGSALTTAIGGNGSNGGSNTSSATAGGSGTGNGGNGASADGSPGTTSGANPGGGGGGRGEGSSTSSSGGNGQVILTWTVTSSPTITSLGTLSGCLGSSITINGTNLSGATLVTIGGTVVSSITTNTATQIVAVIGSGTTGTVSVTTAGGTVTSAATFTVNSLPAQPTTITGNSTPCVGSSQTYSVTNVAGVNYAWVLPSGWSGTSTTNSITVTVGANSGNITVTPSNPCVGTARTLAVTVSTVPSQPSVIGGSTTPCVGSSQTYSVTNVSGVNYAWAFPSGWSGTSTTNSITVTVGAGTGNITVTPSNACGNGTAQTLTTTVNAIPTAANAGSDQILAACATTATLAGNTPTVGTGLWSLVSGTASITTPSSPTSGITGLTIGATATLRWTISNGSCTSSTDDVLITTVAGSGCISYCSPTYSNGPGTTDQITNVTLNTLNNTSGASSSPYYTFFNAVTIPNLTASTTASVSVRFGSDSSQYAAVWIDFNQNGTFEASEGVITGITNGAGPVTINIPVPAGATLGNTRMRVRGGNDSALTTAQACGASSSPYGETEDYIVNIVSAAPLTNGPGGVLSNLQLWLRSDLLNGTTSVTDNTPVNTWFTQARGTDAIKPTNTGAPIYKNNPTANINFNSVVDFTNDYNNAPLIYTDNDATRQYLKGASGFYSQDMFVVLIPDVTITAAVASNDIFCGDKDSVKQEPDATGIGYGAYTARFSGEVLTYALGTTNAPTTPITGYGVANISPTTSYSAPGIINARNNAGITGQELYFNANNHVNTTNDPTAFVNVNDSQYWIGRSEGWTGSLDARVGEIITYSSRLTDIQRSNVQSYLAVKYGITLGVNGTSMNYTNSDGNNIWNTNTGTPANDVFNYDIAGIGRDDIAKLNQKQSKTVNTTDDLTMGLTDIAATNTENTNTFDTDKKYIVWGNNHGTLAAQPQIVVNMSTGITPSLTSDVSFISVGRTWKVVETGGNVGITKVSIPTIMLSATLTPPGDYLMFISSTPIFNPTAEYRVMTVNGSNLETSYDFDGTKYITFGFAPEKTFVRCIKFDGTNDYLDAGKVLNLNTSFTVSAWINRNGINQTILSKRDNGFSTGYDLSINSAGKAEMSWMVGATKHTITSSEVIPTGTWHHIGIIYNGTTAKIYIDGVTKISSTMPNVPANTQSFLIAAADGVATTSYFNGSIDEVRVWKVALTEAQLRYVMNQEILSNGALTNGAIIPNTITQNEISSVQWSNLSAYYPMSTYTYTNAKDISSNNYTAALRNLTTVDRQTAPLPYISDSNATWETPATWLNNTVQDLPNSISIEDNMKTVDWNIVRTSHNISSTTNKTVLGLMVTNNTLTASNDTKIEVSHYLDLDGKIDLVGMSQLVQTTGSDLDVTSAGSIERDQQGQTNKFNYNYWSSPVSPINTTANNTNYTVKGVMKDGFNATPRDINWITGYDGIVGNAGTAVSIARFWLYKFDNKVDAYANWERFLETDLLAVGKGYTLKGNGGLANNFTFVGKPNNGTISNPISANNLFLVGNPYPSAIDAYKFIDENVSSILNPGGSTDGTLYFWQHAPENNTHILASYLGGYALLNKTGGLGTVAPVEISGLGTAAKTPKRFIPVGQGFFVYGTPAGGNVVFNNSQRIFVKENDETSNTLFKTKGPSVNSNVKNQNDPSVVVETYKKIRLGYNTNNGYHRQVLLGFMEENATSGIDYGYDGEILDDFPNDMFLLNSDKQLAIQGEGYFDINASYPIGVKTDVAGKVSFIIDALENFDAQQKVYIYDDETKTYNDIQKNAFEVTLPVGTNDTRFSLRFKDLSSFPDKTLSVEENKVNANDIIIAHIQNSNTLKINNNSLDTKVEKVTLYNINGQSIAHWKIENQNQQNIQIPINTISSGIYIAKLKTTTGELSKKIIIN